MINEFTNKEKNSRVCNDCQCSNCTNDNCPCKCKANIPCMTAVTNCKDAKSPE